MVTISDVGVCRWYYFLVLMVSSCYLILVRAEDMEILAAYIINSV